MWEFPQILDLGERKFNLGMAKSEENSLISFFPCGKCGKKLPKKWGFQGKLEIWKPRGWNLGEKRRKNRISGIPAGIPRIDPAFPMEFLSEFWFDLRQTNPGREFGGKFLLWKSGLSWDLNEKFPKKGNFCPLQPQFPVVMKFPGIFPGILGRIPVG